MRHVHELRAALRGRDTAFGIWASIPTSLTAELAAATGADYVAVDLQHGAAGPDQVMAMLQGIQAGGAAPLARVTQNAPWEIGNALDLGAVGVIVPMVEDGEQAARAVAAARYAPEGIRSTGVVRGDAAEDPVCLVMVETRAALAAVEEIAATPGLDGVYIGPSDLALTFGLPATPRLVHPPVLEAIERVRAVCAEHGIACGLHCRSPEDAARYGSAGFALITVGGDLALLRDALAGALAVARGGGQGAERRDPPDPA